ncbi:MULTISPECIES: hypothetical protein [Nocardioides]|uniref:Mce-associated membrane protein n=1 Tax=Nocardioides vastitatis TaxID=2568655 RepID=A0ABW0ZLS5_9ACTN|nr:hypothetical protein [Nocardioides sp.]THI99403.1 hypothetical protein E7Z54_12600 [Nocardioides sp.]
MSSPKPRRPASSRGATPRPRKIAGQSAPARSDSVEQAHEVEETHEVEGPELVHATLVEEATATQRESWPEEGPPGLLASPTVTRVLITVLAALAVVLVVQGSWWVASDDPERTAVDDAGVEVPSGRPVVADELAVLEGVDAAAKAAQELFSVDYAKYDEELDRAVDLMTDSYEKEYRTTIGDVKEDAVAQQLVVQSNVVAQSVVRANRTRLEALVFLNQVSQRTRDGKPETVVTPYRMLVTMVHTDQGWLVDDLDTDAAEDKKN